MPNETRAMPISACGGDVSGESGEDAEAYFVRLLATWLMTLSQDGEL